MNVQQGAEAPPSDPDYEPPSVASGGAESFVFRAVEISLQVLLLGITARLLEPHGRGLYALAALTAAIISVPLGPVWVGNATELVRDRASARELLGSSLLIALVGGLTTGLIGMGVAALIGTTWWVVAFPAAVAPFILLARYEEGLFQALGRVRATNLVYVGRVVLAFLFIAPPLLAGADAKTAIGIWTLSLVALAVVAYVPLRRLVGRPRLPADKGLYRRVLRTSRTLGVSNAVVQLNPRLALIVLAIFASDATVGVYSVAVAAGDMLLVSARSLSLSAFHGVSRSERTEAARLTVRTLRHAALMAVGGSAIVIPVLIVALPPVIGPGYSDVPSILAVLTPAVLFGAGLEVAYGFFSVQIDKPVVITRILLLMLAVNIPLTFALVPLAGPWGAAAAASIGGALAAVALFRRFSAETGATLRDLRPGRQEIEDYRALVGSVMARLRGRRGAAAS